MTTPQPIERVSLTRMPDSVPECHAYIRELQQEVWRLRRRWAQLQADAADAQRQGHGVDVPSFMRGLEQAIR